MVTGTASPSSVRRKLVVGNWKMNGSRAANAPLLSGLVFQAASWRAEVSLCVPACYIADVAAALGGSAIAWGGQDCSAHESGAYTGEIGAPMLRDLGCSHVIVGHSERRSQHAESDALVAAKAERAVASGLVPIICVGETLTEREAGQTESVVGRQLDAVCERLGADMSLAVVAYEPVWAIGTGKTASVDEAQAVHRHLRERLAARRADAGSIRILYGGSVKADNAAALFAAPDIDGGLIGGASLKAADFAAICAAA